MEMFSNWNGKKKNLEGRSPEYVNKKKQAVKLEADR